MALSKTNVEEALAELFLKNAVLEIDDQAQKEEIIAKLQKGIQASAKGLAEVIVDAIASLEIVYTGGLTTELTQEPVTGTFQFEIPQE